MGSAASSSTSRPPTWARVSTRCASACASRLPDASARPSRPCASSSGSFRYTPGVIVYRAGWVLPVDRPPLRDACVAADGGRVAWVGPAAEAPAGEARDLGPGVLMPGLVNAHCHLELSHLAGRLAGSGGFVGLGERLGTARGQDPMDTVRRRPGGGTWEPARAGAGEGGR